MSASIYQTQLLQHHKFPFGFELSFNVTSQANGFNAACGDEITIRINVDNGILHKVSFAGESCAICRASASMMCQFLTGQLLSAVTEYIELTLNALKSKRNAHVQLPEILQPLQVVKQFPVRQQCAILPWQTIQKTLGGC